MNHKFIQSVSIDWDQIEYNSYLHGIEALKSIEALEFQKNITFLSVKPEAALSPQRQLTLLI